MRRVAVIAKLRPGMDQRALELVSSGPPFDPRDVGFDRHQVYVSGDQVVFVFEGGRLDELLEIAVRNARSTGAFRRWEPLLAGLPRVAKEVYSWERGADGPETAGG